MDTRKIQLVGGGTYTVSLPKEWAESQDIAAGDAVNLHTHIDGLLVVQAQEREDDVPRQITVPVAHNDAHRLERTLRAAYGAGTKEVILDRTDPFTTEQRRVVDRVARNLPSVSVVEESDTKIIVRTLLDTTEVSVRQSVRQFKFVALSMHRDATAALTQDANPVDLADRDDQADRLYAMIDRSFARGLARLDEVEALGVTSPELFELWATTRELERVADHAEGIGTLVSRIDDTAGGDLLDEVHTIASAARAVIADAVSVIIGVAEVQTAQRALRARDHICEDITALEHRLIESSNGSLHLRPILHRLRRTAEHGGNIAELAIQQAIRQDDLIERDQETGNEDNRDQSSPTPTG